MGLEPEPASLQARVELGLVDEEAGIHLDGAGVEARHLRQERQRRDAFGRRQVHLRWGDGDVRRLVPGDPGAGHRGGDDDRTLWRVCLLLSAGDA
jgi:hypothetical protein